jgi:hypothetical protein
MHPHFRHDLVTKPIEEAGSRFIDVTDPESGSTFRFYEVEYALACAMNGSRDVSGLASWAKQELGLDTSAAELETVIGTLKDLGYLKVPGVALGAPGRSPLTPARAASPTAEAVELGQAGKSDISPAAAPAPSAAPNVELGTAGNKNVAAKPDVPADVFSLDSEGKGGASVDLGGHIPAPAAPPVEVPKDLMSAIDATAGPGAVSAETPISLPSTPSVSAVTTDEHAAIKAKEGGTSRGPTTSTVMILLFFLALAAGGLYYYFNVLNAEDENKLPKTPNSSAVVPNPAVKAAPSAVLAEGEAVVHEINSPRDGVVAWLAESGSDVAAGGDVAKVFGFERLERKLKVAETKLATLKTKLDKATAADNENAMKAATTALEAGQAAVDEVRTELGQFVLTSPVAGKVETLVTLKFKVTKDTPVAKVAGAPSKTATFAGADRGLEEGAEVEIASKDDPDATAKCTVSAVEGDKLTVSCAADIAIDSGTSVTLK